MSKKLKSIISLLKLKKKAIQVIENQSNQLPNEYHSKVVSVRSGCFTG
jgi:hypothetical protein